MKSMTLPLLKTAETNQQDALKQAFEARFSGMTLNVTVDLSKYHDAAFDDDWQMETSPSTRSYYRPSTTIPAGRTRALC